MRDMGSRRGSAGALVPSGQDILIPALCGGLNRNITHTNLFHEIDSNRL